MRTFPLFVLILCTVASALAQTSKATSAVATPVAPAAPSILFNTAYESAALGKIEKLSDTEYRVHIKGQQDSRGRNRQATWWAFRMDELAGREITLRITAFKGEYNDKPANSPTGAWYRPVFSYDGENWEHFKDATWDVEKDEITLLIKPKPGANTLWLSHIPPYTHARLLKLLGEIAPLAHTRTEVIGQTVQGRPLHLVTVTNFAKPDAAKKVIWMQARQHAWEAGTSFLLEGALKFVASDDPAAQKLRDENIFVFVPMINVDSVVRGEVRFNVNGFDPNRQWDEVDLRDKRWLERAPEIWYVKKALLAQHARQPIAIGLNMHNTEMNEYLETMVDAEPQQAQLHRFFELAVTKTLFDPSRPKLTLNLATGSGPTNTTSCIWREARIPMMLLEQRIGPSKKLNRIATTQDRIQLGAQLIALMAEVVK